LACGSLNNLAKSDASFGDWYLDGHADTVRYLGINVQKLAILLVVMLQRRSSA
jgi:hypothetical protein